jgi:predicted hotdog family 3-hydroxylacyl-ACP dehydratase
MPDYLAPVEYLPHEAPMVMLDQVHLVSVDHVICSVQVDASGLLAPFLDADGQLPAWFGLEIMAQTVGVSGGWQALTANAGQQSPGMGMLLGSQAYHCDVAAFASGSCLFCEARLAQRSGALSSYECTLKVNDQVLAQARVNTWQATDAHTSDE